MEDTVQIQNNIKKFFKSDKKLAKPEKYIGVELKRIGGLSNVNYSGIVKDMTTNERIAQALYRKFGALSESVNHELETAIINYLAKRGFGPKLYTEVPGDYRISEYLVGTSTIKKENELNKTLLEKLIVVLNIFTSISYTYRYKTLGDNISLTPIQDGIKEKRFNLCVSL